MDVIYSIDGTKFRDYGVFVSESQGLLDRPKQKQHAIVSWDNHHGVEVDLNHRFLEPREIVLICFIKADNEGELIAKVNRFSSVFDAKRLLRLVVEVGAAKPLVYDIYLRDEVDVRKKWADGTQIGLFTLKLIEPHPVKRVLKHIVTSTANQACTISINTTRMVDVCWGDGESTPDVIGQRDLTHTYNRNGTYYPAIYGSVDNIVSCTSNAILIWDKI